MERMVTNGVRGKVGVNIIGMIRSICGSQRSTKFLLRTQRVGEFVQKMGEQRRRVG